MFLWEKVNFIHLQTPWSWVSLKWCTWCDTVQQNGFFSQWWRHTRLAEWEFCSISEADSRMKTVVVSVFYQPWRARCNEVSSIQLKLVHQSLCVSISRRYLTLLVDQYSSFTMLICCYSEISVVKLFPELIGLIDSDVWHSRCFIGYS